MGKGHSKPRSEAASGVSILSSSGSPSDKGLAAPSKECRDTFKALLIGEGGVGKTSLLCRFVDNVYNETPPLIEDARELSVELPQACVKLNFYDTAGQEKFRSITSSFYRNADVLIGVFDICNGESFFKLESWLTDAKHYSNPHAIVIAIGNKTDLDEKRVVELETAMEMANEMHVKLFETSAKTGAGCSEVIRQVAEMLVEAQLVAGVRSSAPTK